MKFNLEDIQRAALKGARVLVGQAWKPAWKAVAARIYELEKTFKEGTGKGWEKGHLRKDIVLQALHSHLDKHLAPFPDFGETLFWQAVSKVIDDYVAHLNTILGQDWVLKVENAESAAAYPLEKLLDIDLDGDGITGIPGVSPKPLPGAPGAIPIAFLFAILLAGDVDAVGHRPHLHPHYGAEMSTIEQPAAEPSPEAPAPSYQPVASPGPTAAPGRRPPLGPHYQPSPEEKARRSEARAEEEASRDESGVTLETWFGHQPARDGIDTGLGAVMRRGHGCVGLQAAQNRVGVCVGYWRLGIQYLWDPRDGTWEPGAYLVPVRF